MRTRVPVLPAPLVDANRIRVPFLYAHIAAYLIGAGMLISAVGLTASGTGLMIVTYLSIAAIGVAALVFNWTGVALFLIIDAVTVGAIPLITGQHPAASHVAMMVVVLTATASTSFRMTVAVAAIEAVAAVIGLVTGPHRPLIEMTPDQVAASELGVTITGLMAGALGITILARLLADSMRIQAEALAAEQRSSRLQQRFIAMVSHELRTPLTSVRGFAEVLSEEGEHLTEAEQREFAKAIAQQSAHLSRLVDDVLVVLRIEADKLSIHLSDLDLAPLIYAAASMISTPDDKRIEVLQVPDVRVVADADRLVQVIRNLVENGLKHGGDHVVISAAAHRDVVRLRVEDNGAGVPLEMSEAVFGDFVQVANPAEQETAGFGLGLPIARRMLDAMGGRVWVDRSDMGGAAFVVELVPAASLEPISDQF